MWTNASSVPDIAWQTRGKAIPVPDIASQTHSTIEERLSQYRTPGSMMGACSYLRTGHRVGSA
eukprot:617743-Rhodomonas_salina.1